MPHEHIRYVPDLGMYAFSRGRGTCLWQTPWCKRFCYWGKFRQMGWSTDESDKIDNSWWQNNTAEVIADRINLRTTKGIRAGGPDRFRFSVHGEIWTSQDDVMKVQHIASILWLTHFWIPTRAWHDSDMLKCLSNVRNPRLHVLALVDPSDSTNEVQVLRDMGWSIMYTGDNDPAEQLMLAEGGLEEKFSRDMYRCPKTWEHKLGNCQFCDDGCFKAGRVEVHLKKHR